MWVLQLKDMRNAKIEHPATPVIRAETKEELESLLKLEKVERYQDDQWGKTFRKDGPLEWFNDTSSDPETYVNVSDEETWAERARVDFQDRVLSIPEIPA